MKDIYTGIFFTNISISLERQDPKNSELQKLYFVLYKDRIVCFKVKIVFKS